MGWFTGGWFVEGWFPTSTNVTPAIVTPAIISAVASAPETDLKLGLRETAVRQDVAISTYNVNNRIGVKPAAKVLALSSGFSFQPNLKTGVKNQAQSLIGRLELNSTTTKLGFKFLPGCCSLSNMSVSSPWLRTGTRQNVIHLGLLAKLQGNQIKIGVSLSSAILNLMADPLIPTIRRGLKTRVLPWSISGSANGVKIKTGTKITTEFLNLLSQILKAKGGRLGALPIVVPLSIEVPLSVNPNLGVNYHEISIILHEGEY